MGKIFKMGVHVDKFIADTVHLSDDEIGKYFRFLCYAWKLQAKLPSDVKRINQIAKNPNIKKTQYLLDTYFDKTKEGYSNSAQCHEWNHVQNVSEKNSNNANLRWDNKKVMPTDMPNNASIEYRVKSIEYNNIIDKWNKIIPTSHIKVFNEPRKRLFKSRFKSFFNESYEEWEQFLQRISKIPFLWGNNDRGWKADFNWVLNEINYAKIIEGNYEKDEKKLEPVKEVNNEEIAEKWIKVCNNPSAFMLSQAEKNFQEIRDLYQRKLLTDEQIKVLGVNVR
mgnify:FL=1